ncbi:MAG: hypothetical protein ACR2IL_02040, partial [Chitinophagaceae bacterium]
MSQRYFAPLPSLLMVCYLWVGLLACTDSNSKVVDVSQVAVPYTAIRYDKLLQTCDTTRTLVWLDSVRNQHPDFTDIFFHEMAGFVNREDSNGVEKGMNYFLRQPDYVGLQDTVNLHFPNTDAIDADLKTLFQYVKYYFPKTKYSKVYYFVSGLNQWSAVTVDTLIGVGLDMYLGQDYPFYASVQLADYQTARCVPAYIPINVAQVIAEDLFPIQPENKTLLDLMLLKGKQQLFLEYTLPKADEEKRYGYKPEQLAWCKENEAMVWHYFAKRNLLYSTQWQEMMRYVNDGPYSTGMPLESPGNIGTWVGHQIIKAYMKKHPEKTFVDIMAMKMDSQAFLRESGYKPM